MAKTAVIAIRSSRLGDDKSPSHLGLTRTPPVTPTVRKCQATMKNLQTKVHALDQEQTRQQELIYSAEFQIQQMERKVARGMGERTDEEKQLLNAKIRDLEVSVGHGSL